MPDIPKDPRVSLALHLGVEYEDWQQDWEYEISGQVEFNRCIELYQAPNITDDERECLIEILLDKVANEFPWREDISQHPFWEAIETLIQNNQSLHADTIKYWQGFDTEHAYAPVSKRLSELFR